MSQLVSYKCKCGSVRVVQSPPVQSEPMQGKRYLGGEPDEGMWLQCEGRCQQERVADKDQVRLGKRPHVHTWHSLVTRNQSPEQLERERLEMRSEVKEWGSLAGMLSGPYVKSEVE